MATTSNRPHGAHRSIGGEAELVQSNLVKCLIGRESRKCQRSCNGWVRKQYTEGLKRFDQQ